MTRSERLPIDIPGRPRSRTRKPSSLPGRSLPMLRGGRPIAWNLVEGVNDPVTGSERAVWLGPADAATVSEPGPARFSGLESVNHEARW